MKIKKITAAVIAATIGASALSLTACGEKTETVYKVFMPDGAPAIALAGLLSDGYDGAEFTVVQSSTIAQRVSTGDADFAIMPINAAATLFNNGVDIVMLSVNTHGNLYIIGDEAATLDSLVGKRLGVIGQGQVPDLTLKMLCAEKGIELVVSAEAQEGKIAVTYGDDGPALAPLIKTGKLDYGLLGEPAATTLSGNLGKKIVTDVQQQWRDAFGGEYPQACLVVKRSVVDSDKKFVNKFLAAVEAQDDFAATSPEKAVAAVEAHMASGVQTSLNAKTLTAEVIARCNVDTVKAKDCIDVCTTYFTKLTELKTALDKPVLAAVPGDVFYYKG